MEKPKAFIALITPISAPSGCPPLQIWGGSGVGDYVDAGLPPVTIVKPPEGPPVFIWGGGNEPFPSVPIVIFPGGGAEPPLVIWGGGGVGDYIDAGLPAQPRPPTPGHPSHPIAEHPSHPIVIPKPPEPFPNPPADVIKPPPAEGGWGFANPPGVWFYLPPSSGAQPKSASRH